MKFKEVKPDSLRVGEYYRIMSHRGIPLRVRLRVLSPCGRYAKVTFSCSGAKLHSIMANDLRKDTV